MPFYLVFRARLFQCLFTYKTIAYPQNYHLIVDHQMHYSQYATLRSKYSAEQVRAHIRQAARGSTARPHYGEDGHGELMLQRIKNDVRAQNPSACPGDQEGKQKQDARRNSSPGSVSARTYVVKKRDNSAYSGEWRSRMVWHSCRRQPLEEKEKEKERDNGIDRTGDDTCRSWKTENKEV